MSGLESKTEVFTVTEMGEPKVEKDIGNRSKIRCKYELYVQPCLAELLGTCLFVFVGCASVIGNVETGGVIQPAVAHGLALGVLITVFGQISGGHFNPAVSLSVYLCGGMKLILLVPYIVAQMAGGVVGAFLSKAVYPSNNYTASLGGAFKAVSADAGRSTLVEMLLTLILTMVVCLGAVNRRTQTDGVPFCIGLTVAANILAGGTLSGACMNPARAFGPAMAANHWDNHWVFWVGPVAGALLTVSIIRLLIGDHKTRVVLK
ncbi:aquaporin-8 [Haplochromis burtoni]|uniref:Aquaporin-4 n=1 Tax=Haplochromis burtoni TaxID=8153 RepID=A0A3Q2VQH5_HAPBU|nr:aquaporin-8 [Haplochromis burtoni]